MNSSLTLLGLLDSEPGYGYDLKHRYDRYFGMGKPLAFGQVYATLARMLRDGFASASGEESDAGPDRKRYAITSEGRDRVNSWLLTPQAPSAALQSELFAKTVIALLTDQDAGRLLDIQRTEHLDAMRELTRRKQAADIAAVVMYDHALFHIEADLRWMDTTEARLAKLAQEVHP